MDIQNAADFHYRFFYDFAFYVIIVVILLNIIFGIIIDTFGALRDESQSRKEHLLNYCFVCNLSQSKLDSAFEWHCNNEHNLWDYLYFIFYLRARDHTLYTGPEQRVAQMLKTSDIGFFPVGRTFSME